MAIRRVKIESTSQYNGSLRGQGQSGKTRICVNCYESSINAVHLDDRILKALKANRMPMPKTDAWYCYPCVKRVEAEISKKEADKRPPSEDIRRAHKNSRWDR
jgi:hypothetical protein